MNGALMAPATPLAGAPVRLRRCAPSAAAAAPPCAAFAALSLSSRSGAGAALRATPVGRPVAARGSLCVVAGAMEVGVGLQGHKAGMTSYFTPEGLQVPVTVIALLPGNVVTQVKTAATDGYYAVQVGYNQTHAGKVNKPELGHLAKSGAPPLRTLTEFRLPEDKGAYAVGQQLSAEALFKAGDLVDVRGTSIGKGFQGGTKRWGFARGLMSHGSKSHRAPGSIGGNTAGRVYKFHRMPGQMGNVAIKIRKLEVVRVSADSILVMGSVPGKAGNILRVTPAKLVGKNLPQV